MALLLKEKRITLPKKQRERNVFLKKQATAITTVTKLIVFQPLKNKETSRAT